MWPVLDVRPWKPPAHDSSINTTVNEGIVSLSPLGVDLTAQESMSRIKEMYEKS